MASIIQSVSNAAGSSLTMPTGVTSGNVLIVSMHGNGAPTGASLGGTALTHVGTTANASNDWSSLWAITINGTTAGRTSVTTTGTTTLFVTAIEVSGITSTVRASATGPTTSTASWSYSIANSVGDFIVEALTTSQNVEPVTTNLTPWNWGGFFELNVATSAASASLTITSSTSGTSTFHAATAVAFVPVTTFSGAPTAPLTLAATPSVSAQMSGAATAALSLAASVTPIFSGAPTAALTLATSVTARPLFATKIPLIPSLPAGYPVRADQMNNLATAVQHLYTPTIAMLVQSSAQSIPANTATALTWNSAPLDTAGGWSASSPTIYTVKTAGIYVINFQVPINGGGAGAYAFWASSGGSQNLAVVRGPGAANACYTAMGVTPFLSGGTQITFFAFLTAALSTRPSFPGGVYASIRQISM